MMSLLISLLLLLTLTTNHGLSLLIPTSLKSLLLCVSFSDVLIDKPTSAVNNGYDAYSMSYDTLDGNSDIANTLGINKIRRNAAKYVQGDTLEFAVGSGLQMETYDWSKLTSTRQLIIVRVC